MFWDKVAGVYDVFTHVINRKASLGMRDAVAALIGSDDEVLECACGTGLLTEAMAGRCKRLTATDFSEKMLLQAEKKCRAYGNVSFEQGNILALDYPDASFDVVVAANVIHLLDEPYRALSEMHRVCRPGGRLIIPTYMNQNKRGKTNGFAQAVGEASDVFKRQFTMESYQQFFRKAGYANVEYTLYKGRIPCAVAVITKE